MVSSWVAHAQGLVFKILYFIALTYVGSGSSKFGQLTAPSHLLQFVSFQPFSTKKTKSRAMVQLKRRQTLAPVLHSKKGTSSAQ
jgi:hypothetical protein